MYTTITLAASIVLLSAKLAHNTPPLVIPFIREVHKAGRPTILTADRAREEDYVRRRRIVTNALCLPVLLLNRFSRLRVVSALGQPGVESVLAVSIRSRKSQPRQL